MWKSAAKLIYHSTIPPNSLRRQIEDFRNILDKKNNRIISIILIEANAQIISNRKASTTVTSSDFLSTNYLLLLV